MVMSNTPAAAASAGKNTAPGASAPGGVAWWVQQFVRTLKTCRLYDSENPTVIKFRQDLAKSLTRLLDEVGCLTLTFTSTDVFHEDSPVYPAQSREDNLARPFHRDGIRAISFQPGIEPAEVETLLDQILRVTGGVSEDEDLVTLLWEVDLPHVDIDCLLAAGDIDSGGGASPSSDRSVAPWPGSCGAGAAGASSDETAGPLQISAWGRSDDWQTREHSIDLEAAYVLLETRAPTELKRFRREIDMESTRSVVSSALEVVRYALAAGPNFEDRVELGRFLPRVVCEAAREAHWAAALEAISMLRACSAADGSGLDPGRALDGSNPQLVAQCVSVLDVQPADSVELFLEFARSLGPEGTEWLMTVLAESEQKRVRRPLTRVIAELSRDRPGRLKPWLTSPHWYVVRNVVHILGWIGGERIVDLLEEVADHPEPRVRQEVVAALGEVNSPRARPILLDILAAAEGRLIGAVLHQLAAGPDDVVARKLADHVIDPGFGERGPNERTAILRGLAATAGDDVLPTLRTALFRGAWFSVGPNARQRTIARSLGRIGSPGALSILRRGARARRPAIRKACEAALKEAHVER